MTSTSNQHIMPHPAPTSSSLALTLASVLGDGKVAYLDSSAYQKSVASYYSVQQATICPACIVLPQTTEDVADIIRTLANEGSSSQFAIRSGGHTSWAGASKIAGWTCDTALNFQVVLSDGQVVDANADENVDLFFAIRGGGCNFGIVTRIDMQTFEQGLFWNASQMRNTTVLDADIKEFVRLSTAEDCDEHASFILVFVYIGSMGMSVLLSGLKSMSTLVIDTAAMAPKGSHSLWRTHTIVSTEAVLQAIYAVWNDTVGAIKEIPGIVWLLMFDPVPTALYARHANTNAFGLTGRDGAALVVILMDVRWSNNADDEVINSTAKDMMDNMEREARALAAYDPFIYLNYAMPDQNPIESYGEEIVRRLVAVRDRVDPVGMFKKQVPGGYKIPYA